MTAIVGSPALRLLLRRKLGGALRKQLRRLNSPAGALFALFGLGLFGLWTASVVFSILMGQAPAPRPELLIPLTRTAMLVLFVMSVAGHLVNRGLYFPKEEIDRLLAAPVTRADIVRYRLHVGFGRAAFGALFLAAVAFVRMPNGEFGALAAFLAVVFITVAGQGIAMGLGAIEHRLSTKVLRNFSRVVFIAMIAIVAGATVFAIQADVDVPALRGVLSNPLVRALGLPFQPWSALATSSSWAEAWPWVGFCTVIALGVFELVARLPFDFREFALDASSDVSERMQRVKQMGAGASAAAVSRGRIGRTVPWLFGRGPLGAVAWRKTASMTRRATSTLSFAAFVMLLIAIFATTVFDSETEEPAFFAIPTAFIGVLYLCGGLRYDFREDIDRMESIKAWPIVNWKLFGAMILPEAVLVTALTSLAIVTQALVTSTFHPVQLAVIVMLPLCVGLWLSVDNALFLKWPVRMVPGQDGALQHMGRAAVLLFLRGIVMGLTLALASGGAVLVAWLLTNFAELPIRVATTFGLVLAFGILAAALFVALRLGGWCLATFDPARDRP